MTIPNTTKKELQAIKQLSSDTVLVTKSDKGGEMVVMRREDMQALILDHLQDTATYQLLRKDPTPSLRLQINKTFAEILRRNEFRTLLINKMMSPPNTTTQNFYALPKTHKKTLKIRPIISGVGGIFERLGWFLNHILQPLLQHIPAHIQSTNELIQRFNTVDKNALQDKLPVSFDVVSLYTNIDITEAIDTALQYLIKFNINTKGLSMDELNRLLHLVLNNNIFHYEERIFKQIRGLAMGSRMSGTLAIIAMYRFEQLHIYNHPKLQDLSVYVRYIDDTGTVVANKQQARDILSYLNSQHATIKFELEFPDDEGFLPILDIKLRIEQDGTIQRKLYTKVTNKGTILHSESHHPTSTKGAVIRNEFCRAKLNSTPEFQKDASTIITEKFKQNGYSKSFIRKATTPNNSNNRNRKKQNTGNDNGLVLRIPFISDRINGLINRALRQNNIAARLVNPRPTTVFQASSSKRAPQLKCTMRQCPLTNNNININCTTSYVVYQAKCDICSQTYIGSTSRQLHY